MSDRMTSAALARSASFCLLALAAATGLATSACKGKNGPGSQANGDEQAPPRTTDEASRPERVEIDLFAFGRQLGTVAPCGCTTDPLGGLQYAFGYIEAESEAGQRLILEPGSFLFPDPEGPEGPVDEAAWAQAAERAKLLQSRFSQLDGLVSGLGPTDYAEPEAGAESLATFPLPRVLGNVAPTEGAGAGEGAANPAGVEPLRVISLGHGLEAAVTVVVDPALAEAARGSWAADFPALQAPVEALAGLAPALAKADLQVVVVHGPRDLAETVAREVEGLDVVVMGGVLENADLGRLGSAPVQIGQTWLLQPGDRGQSISHLTFSLSPELPEGELPESWTLQPSATQLTAELERLESKLAKLAEDPAADAAFLARLEADRDALKSQLEDPSIPAEVAGAVITAQTKVSCRLPEDDAAKTALSRYDGWVAQKNAERFAGVKPPEPAPGKPGYVGVEACADCHEEAVALWKTTVHAGAYETLAVANKQYDLSCVGCHVTGFREPGGSEVVENEGLRDVQCEQCHGPGSLHVEDPRTDNIQLEPPRSLCLGCHTQDHSDTFDFEPYLRDVLGEGHGADARAALGEGPTAHALRQAGLEAAGGGCEKSKM
ncbi:hypothetical protein G6O69_08400 [Pseudenhygromyxa sp. WMMC2535]|uniref:multiheme c-type cytochrome n=1 Tax=Pseudenhygromyxa sp. WMMC2535 TaxID=2712867 RepID=UPI0015527C81|nr:multiheme c-type cytochrome [Pseudenhygromyxa sp. WMMC2535]NVB37852.1 hypothetical protein [Pseudenhygromyxa sp. WMMC2535]